MRKCLLLEDTDKRLRALQPALEAVGFRNVRIYSIFRSRFARDLFMDGLRNGFCHRYAKSIWLAWRLRWADWFAHGERGLFLIVRAEKPAA